MGNNRSRDLDPTDAHFVDVLHTGAGVLGQIGPNGHADYYFNGKKATKRLFHLSHVLRDKIPGPIFAAC